MDCMAVVPFHEQAMAHWFDEVEQAHRELLASLETLRDKADGFLTVSALATTLFAVLGPRREANGSDLNATEAAMSGNGTADETPSTGRESSATAGVPVGPAPNGTAPYPDTDRRGILRFRPSDIERSGPAGLRAITSPNKVVATAGVPLSFTVTTTGAPVPSIATRGALPMSVWVVDNHDGTALLCGTPTTKGEFRSTIRCSFGRGADKYVVTQAFTVTVIPG
jgi:hypothetical protein